MINYPKWFLFLNSVTYVCYMCTRKLSLLEKAIKDRKAFRELAISSLNAQMKKRTRVASFPGSPKARAEEKKRRAWYQPSTHAQVLPRFWVNRILSVHPPSPKRHHS